MNPELIALIQRVSDLESRSYLDSNLTPEIKTILEQSSAFRYITTDPETFRINPTEGVPWLYYDGVDTWIKVYTRNGWKKIQIT
jgi:hypothetical protein